MARRLGVEGSVIFCGAVPNTEIPAYLNASDVFLNPTMRIEGLPIVIVEALACGKPVIAHRIGGIPTVVENGVNGVLLAPSTDSAQLARKTIEILSDSSLLEKLAQNAQARSLRELGGDTMTDEYLSIIKKTLMGKEQLA
jgi:glycosyltransferase involved in cell wall biosynthesis